MNERIRDSHRRRIESSVHTTSLACRCVETVVHATLVLASAAVAITFSSRAAAQSGPPQRLNENCIVSVLNRNVRVKPDGTWVLPNIPANFGLVRARATCIFDGVTVSGESAPFLISANGSVNVPPIILGSTTPIPTSISITAPAGPLSQIGAVRQLAVTARYADGTSRDVTAGTTGTTYVVSNPALVSVTGDGLVQALASGTVLVQAINEGTGGFASIQVVLGGDSDGDGIPDDIEIRLGLNPNNAADALEDPDRDGLSNLDEYRIGTDPHNADTDGDGLLDGDEVARGTSPLLADTDGDGISDGLEVATGSDPLNAASMNLSRALSSIEVTPATFVLTVNSIVGQAFQQLTVTGHLTDGKTLDLTSTLRGTNYSSSNLNVCSFGAPDGRVFGGTTGPCTITVTNSGFTAQASGTVNSFTPTPLSFVSIPGFANGVAVNGNYAYVAAGSAGLQVVDVTDRAHPHVVASLQVPGNANDVKLVSNLAYIAAGNSGLDVVDITNPLAPVLRGILSTGGNAMNLAVRGGVGYIANGSSLFIADVSNVLAMNRIAALPLAGTVWGVDVDPQRNLAAIAAGASGVYVIDVSNPAAPVTRGQVSTGDARDVAVRGSFVFVADRTNSLTSVDITTPSAPLIRSNTSLGLGGRLNDVVLSGNFALGADIFFVNGIPITDISDPSALSSRAILNFPQRDDNGMAIAADGNFVYLATEHSSLDKGGSTGDSRLYIGQYLAVEDRGGVPPTVQITSPTAGSTSIEGTSISVRVDANDDVAVSAVNFLVNGQVVFTDTTFPYEFTVTAPLGASTLTLGATAVDLGGNVGTAQPVQVTVIPDPLTMVVGRVVDRSGTPVSGATITTLTFTTTSAADGTFTIGNVPTIQGGITVSASGVIAGQAARGRSASTVPVPAGVTNVGNISLRGGRVLFLGAETDVSAPLNAIASAAAAAGLFTLQDVDTFSVRTSTPTLAQLQNYGRVLVWSNFPFSNAPALGNVLADYVDQGGGVVTATFAHTCCESFGNTLTGRLVTGGYTGFVYSLGSSQGGVTTLSLANSDTSHPIMQGVAGNLSFSRSDFSSNGGYVLTSGSTVVARDTSNYPKVAVGPKGNGHVVSIAIYPGPLPPLFPTLQPGIARLFANALDFVW